MDLPVSIDRECNGGVGGVGDTPKVTLVFDAFWFFFQGRGEVEGVI